ncbi:hypothetical protein D039_3637A, partial [Vibrio parahaemolyticus EKP-028]
MQGQVPSQQAQ